MNYQQQPLNHPQQQYPAYNNQPIYAPNQTVHSNPTWQQQSRPPNYPHQQPGMNGNVPMAMAPPGQSMGSNLSQQQQQQIMAMMAARQSGAGPSGAQQPQQSAQGQGQGHGQGYGQGMMPPPAMIPGINSGIQGMTREQQQAAFNMMQAQQAAILQQQQQQQHSGGAGPHAGPSGERAPAAPSHKKKKPKLPPPPAHQMLPRQPPPPRSNEAYRQAAMGNMIEIEPWADGLDEVDPRELAMGRFRSRQEAMTEIFSAEPIKDILAVVYDPWSGLGMTAETLADKVAKLEHENEELSRRMDSDVGAFRKRLADAEGVELSSVMVPA